METDSSDQEDAVVFSRELEFKPSVSEFMVESEPSLPIDLADDWSKTQLRTQDASKKRPELLAFYGVTCASSTTEQQGHGHLDTLNEFVDDDDFWDQGTRTEHADKSVSATKQRTELLTEDDHTLTVSESETEHVEISQPIKFKNEEGVHDSETGITADAAAEAPFGVDLLRDSLIASSSPNHELAEPLVGELEEQNYSTDSEDEWLPDVNHQGWTAVGERPSGATRFSDTSDDEYGGDDEMGWNPATLMDEATGASGKSLSPPDLISCNTKFAETWPEESQDQYVQQEAYSPLDQGLPDSLFHTRMKAPVKVNAKIGNYSDSSQDRFPSRCGIDFSQNMLVPNTKLSPATLEFLRHQKAGRNNEIKHGVRRPGTHAPLNKSFPPNEASRIERSNQILLSKLVETASQRRTPYGLDDAHPGRAKHIPPSAVFRQRNSRRIEHENQLLLKRLRVVKASKEITANFSAKKKH